MSVVFTSAAIRCKEEKKSWSPHSVVFRIQSKADISARTCPPGARLIPLARKESDSDHLRIYFFAPFGVVFVPSISAKDMLEETKSFA